MQRIKSLCARVAVLSFALMLVYGYANAQCSPVIGDYSDCATQFLSISSSSCEVSNSSRITITVNQAGASYNAYVGGDAYLISAPAYGTTLTYVIGKRYPGATSAGIAVHMAGTCSNNFASATIQ